VLAHIVQQRAPDLRRHGDSVAAMALQLGRAMGLTGSKLKALTCAAELHDVGKVVIPDAILDKPAPLSEDEWGLMRRHTVLGQKIIVAAPSLAPLGRVVRATHERWDGNGYPDGLAGEAIPFDARIIFVCDAYDALLSERPYAPPMSAEEALAEVRRNAGSQFDPAAVNAFCKLAEESTLERAWGSEPPAWPREFARS